MFNDDTQISDAQDWMENAKLCYNKKSVREETTGSTKKEGGNPGMNALHANTRNPFEDSDPKNR